MSRQVLHYDRIDNSDRVRRLRRRWEIDGAGDSYVTQSKDMQTDCVCLHVFRLGQRLHEAARVCVLIHVGVVQASFLVLHPPPVLIVPRANIPKHHQVYAPSVLLENMLQKTEAHHVFGVMRQAGMSVSRDQKEERVSSAPHISCVSAAHQAARPSPSYA